MMIFLGAILLGSGVIYGLNWLSYHLIKSKILDSQSWDLNVCCGRTDGGGINTDIVNHADVPNLVIADPLNLPFKDQSFGRVLCSHAAEHMKNPQVLMVEMNRVGREVTMIVPPIWDLAAALNLLEHRWIFISIRKRFKNRLPKHIRLPLAGLVQKCLGQFINA
jgi:hypothetical protein